jgi:excisionase family DNA binding protein
MVKNVQAKEGLMSVQELSAYLSVPEASVYAWRYRGTGPTAVKVGRYLRYRPQDVEDWLQKNTAR